LPYGLNYALTDSILQEVRSEVKAQLFGKSEENVQFAEGMKTYLERSGHVVNLKFTTRKKTLPNVEHLVVSDEMLCLKAKDNRTPATWFAGAPAWLQDLRRSLSPWSFYAPSFS
jgi:hypothetical protein